jgi:hypothetical protein
MAQLTVRTTLLVIKIGGPIPKYSSCILRNLDLIYVIVQQTAAVPQRAASLVLSVNHIRTYA